MDVIPSNIQIGTDVAQKEIRHLFLEPIYIYFMDAVTYSIHSTVAYSGYFQTIFEISNIKQDVCSLHAYISLGFSQLFLL